MTRYTDLSTGKQLPETDPRTLSTKEERIAAAQAEQAAFELQQEALRTARRSEQS